MWAAAITTTTITNGPKDPTSPKFAIQFYHLLSNNDLEKIEIES